MDDAMDSHVAHDSTEEDNQDVCFNWKLFLFFQGPGLLMSMTYLDPGALEANLQLGSYTGLNLLWVHCIGFCGAFIFQTVATRVGNVSGHDLAELCARELHPIISMAMYVALEMVIVSTDTQALIGGALALHSWLQIDFWAGCLITVAATFLLLLIDFFSFHVIERVFACIIVAVTSCFIFNFFAFMPPFHTVVQGFVPRASTDLAEFEVGLATLGTMMPPHSIFLQSALVLSRQIDRTSKKQVSAANKYCTFDVALSLLLIFFVNVSVTSCFGQAFYDQRCKEADGFLSACIAERAAQRPNITISPSIDPCYVNTLQSQALREGVCGQLGLEEAGYALKARLGNASRNVWQICLLACSQLATLSCTLTGQFISEGFLQIGLSKFARALFTRGVSLVPAIMVCFVIQGGSLVNRLDAVTNWINVLQFMAFPVAAVPMLTFADSKQIMGEFCNSNLMSATCWLMLVTFMSINLYLQLSPLQSKVNLVDDTLVVLGIAAFTLLYVLSFCGMLGATKGRRNEKRATSFTTYGSTDILADLDREKDESFACL